MLTAFRGNLCQFKRIFGFRCQGHGLLKRLSNISHKVHPPMGQRIEAIHLYVYVDIKTLVVWIICKHRYFFVDRFAAPFGGIQLYLDRSFPTGRDRPWQRGRCAASAGFYPLDL